MALRRHAVVPTLAIISVLLCFFVIRGSEPLRTPGLESSDNLTCAELVQERFNCSEPACDEEATIVNYLYASDDFFYCGPFSGLIWLNYILMIVLCVLFLRVLGNTADDYFCVCIEALIVKYGISPNTAGVTFLSFGNGSADVFAIIVSFLRGSYELGIGGNLGASLFITTVVFGLIVSHGDFELNTRPFLRDIIFLFFAVLYLFVLYAVGIMSIATSCVIILIYVVFVLVVIFCGDMKKADPPVSVLPTGDASSALGNTLEEPLIPKVLGPDEGTSLAMIAASKMRHRSVSDTMTMRSLTTPTLDRRRIASLLPMSSYRPDEPATVTDRLHWKDFLVRQSLLPVQAASESPHLSIVSVAPPAKHRRTILTNLKVAFTDLCKRRVWIVFNILELPFTLLRLLTIPFLNPDFYSRDTNAVAAFFFPLFFAFGYNLPFTVISTPIYAVIGLGLSAFAWFRCKWDGPPESTLTFSVIITIAFVSCVTWIYKLAEELVNILHSLGYILNIDDTLMGLTVLALGNSVGDFVADISVAKQGFPLMALAGCLCSPLFQILIGLGSGLLIQTIRQGTIHVRDLMAAKDLTVIYLTFIFILIGLMFSTMVPFLHKNRFPRYYSFVIIGYYAVYAVLIILFGTGVLRFSIHF